MEAVMKYYPSIYQYRHYGTTVTNLEVAIDNGSGSANPEIDTVRPTGSSSMKNPRYGFAGHPLSRLSYRLLQAFFVFCFLMLLWSLFGKYYFSYVIGRHRHGRHQYGIQDFGLLIATLVQSFVLLWLWAYYTNRIKPSELSLDAIIKYFASGFFLSASLALFWEMLTMGIIKTFISLLLAIFGIDRVASPETDHSWITPFGSNALVNNMSSISTLVSNLYGSAEMNRTDYATVFGLDHPFLYSLYILITTFIVAGFVEELCKYFGYRMVEHPDFFTSEELEEASMILQSSQDNAMDDVEDSDENSDTSRLDRSDTRARPAIVNYTKQRQSVQGRGAAITLAMVSVAIGFSCCENLIYVFHYAGESVMLELGVLLERSCFPIHAVFAAIQSIGVCQRELEGVRSMRLGRIILPAVIFHGTFDFFIIFIGFIGTLVGQDEEEGDLRITNTTEFLAIVSCVIIMTTSLLYLYNESGKQRERLAAIDYEATVDRSSLL
jgi:RsiW-degrading membrane proteinase PrsW (M82 family)